MLHKLLKVVGPTSIDYKWYSTIHSRI